MGHHRSHNRASKGGTPEVLSNHIKHKHDTHECGSKTGVRTRREKRSHKRKRDDTSKRRHKERRRGSHGSSRSSSKGKPREKAYRWKDSESSDSDSSSGLLSSKGGQRGSRGAGVNQKRARSPSTVPHKENHNEHRSKRVKSDEENFRRDDIRENCDSLIKPSSTEEEVVHKSIDSDLEKVGKYTGAVSSSKGTRSERDETKGQEQEMRLEGRKGNVLEVELRQKALANFMRHQDVLWRTDPQGPMVDGDTRQLAAYNERDVQGVGEVGKAVGDAINVDAPKDAPRCPCTHDTVLPIDVKCLAEENDNNLEEGEIKSDNETEHGNSSSVVHKILHENLEGNPHAIRDDFEKQDDSRITSMSEIERAGVSMAASCVNKMQELCEGQAGKDSPGVDQASSQRDSSNNFQEKTMSVMRGGEMVQVSYKVYIPKRAAELARRRLQR